MEFSNTRSVRSEDGFEVAQHRTGEGSWPLCHIEVVTSQRYGVARLVQPDARRVDLVAPGLAVAAAVQQQRRREEARMPGEPFAAVVLGGAEVGAQERQEERQQRRLGLQLGAQATN